jgi:hypothetical protein
MQNCGHPVAGFTREYAGKPICQSQGEFAKERWFQSAQLYRSEGVGPQLPGGPAGSVSRIGWGNSDLGGGAELGFQG